jgi:pyruvate dehydrogenase E1 component alpha subunit
MAEEHTQTDPAAENVSPASESPDHQEPGQAPEVDRAWQQSEKPQLSDEERLQGLSPDQLRKIMYDMLLARRFEEKTAESYALGKIGGFCHLYIGQEAVAVGAIAALEKDDYVMTAYREHVHAIQCGITPNAVMAELYGRKDGCSGGKGGSMHLFSSEHDVLGG